MSNKNSPINVQIVEGNLDLNVNVIVNAANQELKLGGKEY